MTVRVLVGNNLEILRGLPDRSVQTCVTSPPYFGLRSYLPEGHSDKPLEIGLEETPDAYVARLVDVFREVRRVLRDDGTLWLNLGDSYARAGGEGGCGPNAQVGNTQSGEQRRMLAPPAGYKPKDLLGIPWMVAFALRADGWWLRSDIIWHKPNPMPESVRDRPTSAHEHVFLLSKRAAYFYDAAAIAEPSEQPDRVRADKIGGASHKERQQHSEGGLFTGASSRNARNVWSIATQPYSGAHFATMPPALAERCILAGSSAGGQCPHCTTPWVRVVEFGEPDLEHQRRCGGDATGEYHGQSTKGHAAAGVQDASAVKARILAGLRKKATTGWQPTCDCPDHAPVPQVILDPFGGAGTTGLVADRLGRSSILCELNPAYAALAAERITADAPLLGSVA